VSEWVWLVPLHGCVCMCKPRNRKTGLDEDHAFHIQLLEYSQDELYEAHTDCSNGQTNDRAGTSLIYLTDPEGGGETSFPELGISIKPKKGMGLFFGSLDTRGRTGNQGQKAALPFVAQASSATIDAPPPQGSPLPSAGRFSMRKPPPAPDTSYKLHPGGPASLVLASPGEIGNWPT
jgi:hypothetical protein